jgi:hypothetical protein
LNWLDSNDVTAIGMLIMNLEMKDDNSTKLKLIRLLLKQGVNLNSEDSKKSPLLWSLYKHQFALAAELIDYGANCNVLN